MKQPIFVTIENKFRSFVKGNIRILENIGYNEIINITNKDKQFGCTLCSINMLEEPFNITYIGKRKGEEGDFYYFFDVRMDKIYTYYAVK